MSNQSWWETAHTPAVAKPVARRPETVRWALRKDGRVATASVRAHPHGTELVFRVDDTLLWSQVYRAEQQASREEMIFTKEREFRALGWTD